MCGAIHLLLVFSLQVQTHVEIMVVSKLQEQQSYLRGEDNQTLIQKQSLIIHSYLILILSLISL